MAGSLAMRWLPSDKLPTTANNMQLLLRFAFSLALASVLTGCASVSVQNEASRSTQQMPARVYVEGFATANGKFKVDREDAELADFKQNLQSMMQKASVNDLSRRLIPAVAASETQSFPPRECMARSRRVHQGQSRQPAPARGCGFWSGRHEAGNECLRV